jgi:hypothetical protein
MAEQVKNVSIEPQQRAFLPEFSWEGIEEPGTYVEMGSGDLYRIPKEALLTGSSPLIRKHGIFEVSAGKQRPVYHHARSEDGLC